MTTLAEWLGERAPARVARALPIYRQQQHVTAPDDVVRLAERLGLEAEPVTAGDVHVASRGTKVLVAHANGPAFWFADLAKLDNPEYRPELPSQEEAKEAALAYLRRQGWLPRRAVVHAVHHNELEQIQGRDRVRSSYPNHVCVDLRLSLGPLTTYGPGAKVKVLVGAENEVIGLFHAVPRLRKVADVRPTPRRGLAQPLLAKLGLAAEDIELKDATLAYVVDSTLSGDRLVQPAYILTLATRTTPRRSDRPVPVEFMTHPLPASRFGPQITIRAPRAPIEIPPGEGLRLSCTVKGGKAPHTVLWGSNVDGVLGEGPRLKVRRLSTAHRGGRVTCHTVRAVVTDANGLQDSHSVLVRALPWEGQTIATDVPSRGAAPGDPLVGVEWCNLYHGAPGLADISGTDTSAQGFRSGIQGLPSWSSRFDWGNDAAWEQDFKSSTAPGGGTDSYWADNIHLAFFAGHGSSGAFYFGSQVDDHQMVAEDARWGDGMLNWIVLHACQTMRANFMWDVWCDAFKGLHEMFGFHTNTEGSTPPLGSRFAFWASLSLPLIGGLFDLRTAWRLACTECFDSGVENAVIYANQTGTDTQNDHLSGYGHVSPDPTSPNVWVYSKQSC